MDVSTWKSTDGREKEIPVKVAVMIRPLVEKELSRGSRECLEVLSEAEQVVLGTKHAFTFDKVYGGNGRQEGKLFEECILPLLDGVLEGYNGTVFAYGQTGSGKTYTMGSSFLEEDGSQPLGIIPRTIEQLFEKMKSMGDRKEFTVTVSFIELHKESIHDLLSDRDGPQTQCFVREFPGGNVSVSGATEVPVSTAREMLQCLQRGTLYRTTASTGMNKRSSRSHAIFTVTVDQCCRSDLLSAEEPEVEGKLLAKLNLVDLAGSERVKKTNAEGIRLEEGIHINRGLLALGNVISALAVDHKVGTHVPYRNSKLTRLLQDSLGGNSRTVMIACVSPADINFDETLNTLKYANRARNIKNKPIVNHDSTTAEIMRLRQEISELTMELEKTKHNEAIQNAEYPNHRLFSELESRCIAAELESTHLRGELASARAGEELSSRRLLQVEKQRDYYRIKLEKIAAKDGEIPDVTSEDLSVLEEHLVTIQALERTVSRYSHLEAAGADILVDDQETIGGSDDFDCSRTLNFDSLAEAEEYEAGARRYMKQQEELDRELGALEESLRSKEEQMRQMSNGGEKINAITSYYENALKGIEQERRLLLEERNGLLQAMQASKKIDAEERLTLESKYKQKLKDLEEKLEILQEKAKDYIKLERLKQKSEHAAMRLESQIFQIKQQKVHLMKKIEASNKEFLVWKKSQQREVLKLTKERQKDRVQLARLKLINQKQEMVLKRRTEEAAAAKARVQDLLRQRMKRGETKSQTEVQEEDYSTLVIRPNCRAPELHNEKQRRAWVMKEISTLVELNILRREMEELVAKRCESTRTLEHLKAELERQDTEEQKQVVLQRLSDLEEEISLQNTGIQAMQEKLVDAESHNSSEFSTEEVQRWLGLRSLAEARCMLRTLFRLATASAVSCDQLRKDLVLRQQEIAVFQRNQHGTIKLDLSESTKNHSCDGQGTVLLPTITGWPEDKEILEVLQEQRTECDVFESLHPEIVLDSSTTLDSCSDVTTASEASATPRNVTESEHRENEKSGSTSHLSSTSGSGSASEQHISDPHYSARSSAIKTWWGNLEESSLLELVHDYPKAKEIFMSQSIRGVDSLKDLLFSFHGAAFWYYRYKRLQMQNGILQGGRRLDTAFNEDSCCNTNDPTLSSHPSECMTKTIETSAKLREGAREARERIERYLRQSTMHFKAREGSTSKDDKTSPLADATNKAAGEISSYPIGS